MGIFIIQHSIEPSVFVKSRLFVFETNNNCYLRPSTDALCRHEFISEVFYKISNSLQLQNVTKS